MIPERRRSLRFHCFNVGKLYFDRLEEEMEAKKWEVTKKFWFDNALMFLCAGAAVTVWFLSAVVLWH